MVEMVQHASVLDRQEILLHVFMLHLHDIFIVDVESVCARCAQGVRKVCALLKKCARPCAHFSQMCAHTAHTFSKCAHTLSGCARTSRTLFPYARTLFPHVCAHAHTFHKSVRKVCATLRTHPDKVCACAHMCAQCARIEKSIWPLSLEPGKFLPLCRCCQVHLNQGYSELFPF